MSTVEQELQSLLQCFSICPMGIVQLDREGHILRTNPAADAFLGCIGDGADLFECLGESGVNLQEQARAFRGSSGVVGEVQPISAGNCPQGTPRYCGVTLVKVDQDRYMALLTDVSGVVAKEREAHVSGEERDRFFALAPSLLCIAGFDGRFRRVNPAWETILGFSTAELLARPFVEFVHPDDRQSTMDELGALIEGVTTFKFENRYICKDGGYRWLSWTAAPDMERGVVYAAARDVTDAKTAQLRLEQNERRVRRILNAAADGIFTFDQHGTIGAVNRAMNRIFGYGPEQLEGRNVRLLLSPQDALVLDERVGGFMRSGDEDTLGASLEMSGRRADGSSFPIELTVREVQSEDRRVFTAIVHDISQRKEYEQTLERAKEAAEAAAKAKSDFLANISHEIRTPLHGVIGMTEMALETTLDGEQRDYLENARRSAHSLLRVINELLDFSKIEAGRVEFEKAPFSLRECVGDALQLVAASAYQKGLELVWHVAADVPDILLGDAGRLGQVLLNLVGNAVKFTERGEVCVAARCEERGRDDLLLHVEVRDTGIGIPPEKQERIFEAFSQADASTSRKYGGTGLGLAISAELVRLMGGRMWLESEVERGSTFHFVVRMGIGAEGEPPVEGIHRLRGLRVLVVDDNDTNRRVLEDLLRRWGLVVQAVEGAASATAALLAALEDGRPIELVLADYRMPVMDGLTFASNLRDDPRFRDVPVLLLTSGGRGTESAEADDRGIAGRLRKPLRPSDLLDAIRAALGEPTSATMQGSTGRVRPGARGVRVLLAEDNPINQRLARALLERRGHTVRVAGDGSEAVAARFSEPLDIVLMDVQMPEMDGYAATRAIRDREEREGAQRVPIVALTAHVMVGDRERCLEAGMDEYIAKPIDAAALEAVIQRLVSKEPTP